MDLKGRFNANPQPLCIHEVIADGPIQTPEYYSVGKVTEFNGCYFLECIRGGDLNCLYNYGMQKCYAFEIIFYLLYRLKKLLWP